MSKTPHHRINANKQLIDDSLSRKSIKYGLAVIPFDERGNFWLLPDGPNQKNRKLSSAQVATQFAIRLNNILKAAANKYARLINS